MEKKKTKASKKKLWSIYIFIRSGPKTFRKYLYLNVTQFYQEEGLLHVWILNGEHHMHELSRIESIQVREYLHDRIQ